MNLVFTKYANFFSPAIILSVLLVTFFALAFSTQTFAQKAIALAASADIDQCRNGPIASPVPCNGGAWVNGNVGPSQSHWVENEFAPYRVKMQDLTISSSYTITIGYDILKSGKHAVDYLGTFNATDPLTDPCAGVAGCVLGSPTSTVAVPLDNLTVRNQPNPNIAGGCPFVAGPGCVVQAPGNFTMWGGTLTSAVYEPYTPGDEHRAITITFTATTTNPVLAWSGHLAWVGDWGAGNSAGTVSGSPYHGSLDACSFGCGSQDRSMSIAASAVTGAVFIKKVVNTLDGSGNAVFAFPFTASANFGPTSFSLIDDNSGPGIDTQASQTIANFGPSNAITVTEGVGPAGWTLADVNCVESSAQDSTKSPSVGPATIIVQVGEVVSCTFTNTQLVPSASNVTVAGRVLDPLGNPLSKVTVRLTDIFGATRTATTGAFGYYRFDEVESGQVYVIGATSKRYTFQSQALTVGDDIFGFDIISN